MNLLDDSKNHIQSLNKFMPLEELDKKSPEELLHLVHPGYRNDYAQKLYRANEIDLLTARKYATRL